MDNNELLKAIGEIIDTKLEPISQEITAFKQEFTEFKHEVNTKFDQVNTKFDQVNTKFDQVNTKFDQVNVKIDDLRKDIKESHLSIGDKIITSSEHLDNRIVSTETNILNKLDDMKTITADNCYDIAVLKHNQRRA